MASTQETQLPDEAFSVPLSGRLGEVLRAAGREVWRFFPAWLYLFYGCLLLNAELTNLQPPRVDLAPTAAFPLAVFVAFSAVRAFTAPGVRNRGRALGIPLALAVGLPLINFSWHRPSPLSGDALLRVYELSNFAWAALMVAHAWSFRKSHIALFFGAGLLYGAVLENGGIVLGFFHEMNLGTTMVKPLVAPVATMIGWCVVIQMATFVVWHLRRGLPWLRRSALGSAVLVGAVATLLDLQIDPIATASGCWVWHESLPGWFHGVPAVNFIAWMCAVSSFAYVVFQLQARHGLEDDAPWSRNALAHAFAAVPYALVLAAVSFCSVTLLVEGPRGPSWSLLAAFTSRALGVLGL
jgi:uncharacterized membrane protein